MKRTLLFAATLILCATISTAQPSKPLKKVMELAMPEEGGSNGAAVVWHPGQKKYYAAMAGNESFPLSVFDAKGKRLSEDDSKAYFDIRGMWYNVENKKLEANGYNDFGWASFELNKKGIPTGVEVMHEGMNQPDEQVAGIYNPKDKSVYFFSGEEGSIEKYDYATAEMTKIIELYLGFTKADADDFYDNLDAIEDYNTTTAVYTGIEGAEIGLLNSSERRIELYNISTGYMVRMLELPSGSPTQYFLNFSYSNGIYWLFDKETRIWKGYK